MFIPNLNDVDSSPSLPAGVSMMPPTEPLTHVVASIAEASLVIGSSLHAAIVADAYGVPARIVASNTEPAFKYADYYEGTGRADVRLAKDVGEALDMGGAPLLSGWSSTALRKAFPDDLWAAAPE